MSISKTARRCAVAVAAAALTFAIPQQASAAGGNVAIDWSIPGTPSSGLTNVAFPITVNPATAHESGLYFAQEFGFKNSKEMGYTGLQPRPDSGGHERLHGVFSAFGAGISSSDSNCHAGADSGQGVSCSVDFDGVYGHTYALKVARSGTDTWTGIVTDTVTKTSHHIGTYTMPANSGNLMGWYGGFVEYYLGVPTCSQLLRTDVVFGGPTTTDGGGLTGTSTATKEYADCIGQADYHATQVGNGTHITRGTAATRAAMKPADTSAGAPSAAAQAPAASGTTPSAPAPNADSASNAAAPNDSPDLSSVARAKGAADHQALAHTGSDSVLPEVGVGAGALVTGGGVLWAVRRRNGLRRSALS